ncbi:MAG: hypothetical protein JNL62_23640, partial [Bryobacterales bacterium]|nr:hypothetical protein [Bryobacterales bacterium]
MTRWRIPLRTQVLLCAAMNLVLLLAGLAVLFWSQFDAGFESFLLAPTQAKLRGMGDRLVDDMVVTPAERRGDLLARYEREYGVELGLFTDGGEPVAGRFLSFPPLVRRVIVPPKGRIGEKRMPPPEGTKKKKKGFDASLPVGQRPHHPILTVKDQGRYWFGIRMPVPAAGSLDVLHGVLLAVHFSFPDASRAFQEQALDIILVNSRSPRKPAEAQVLAQTNLD